MNESMPDPNRSKRGRGRRAAAVVIAGLGVIGATAGCTQKPPPPPPQQTCRPLDFERAIIEQGDAKGATAQWNLTVNGMVSGGHAALRPVTYIQQPDYWMIEVDVCSQPGVSYPAAFFPYTVTLDLTGVLGTKGVEVKGASRSERLDVPLPASAPKTLLQGTSWTLNGTTIGDTPVPAGRGITANFGPDVVSGSAACNLYRAGYHTLGQTITFGPIITTKIACTPDTAAAESAFLTRLAATKSFSLRTEYLTLTGDPGSIPFVRAPAATPGT